MIGGKSFAGGCPFALAVTFAVNAARAQSAGENANVAEALFRDGVTLFERGRVAEACDKFAESFRLDPANGTLLNAALCHERQGKTASAWAEFSQLAGRAAQASQKDRETLARSKAAELESKLSRVALVFGASSNVDEVWVDGHVLGRAAWTTPLPLDPGTHAFVFRAVGKRENTRSITLGTGASTKRIDVPVLDDANEHAPIATEPAANETAEGGSLRRPLAYGVGAVGLAALGIGTYFGVRTLSKKSDVDAHCTGRFCDADGLAADSDAHSAATLSTIAFGVGVAGIATAVILLLSAHDERPSAARAHIAPRLEAHAGTLGLEGRF